MSKKAPKLFQSSDLSEWETAYRNVEHYISIRHDPNLKTRRDLISDNDWLWHDLSSTIQNRKKSHKKQSSDFAHYITKDELKQIMRWKLARGKFRASLFKYIQSNSEAQVMQHSGQAFHILQEYKSENGTRYDVDVIKKAVKELCNLKGVGPATASIVLAAYDHFVPFMADEAMLACKLQLKYTMKQYLEFYQILMDKCDTLNKEERVGNIEDFTPFIVSECLWSEHMRHMHGEVEEDTEAEEEQVPDTKRRGKKRKYSYDSDTSDVGPAAKKRRLKN